jgi:hypothetical protein
VRHAEVEGRKAYFLSDIHTHYGKAVGQKVKEKGNIFSRRVTYKGNSQTRNLIFDEDLLKVSFNDEAAAPTGDKKIQLHYTDVCNSINNVKRSEEYSSMKKHIKKLCQDWSIKRIKEKGLNVRDISNNGGWEYREPYRLLYSCFDRFMADKLKEIGKTLEDIGLGIVKSNGKPYIDRIADAEQLENLHVVARALFEPKKATNN